jgi:hypothetical protein
LKHLTTSEYLNGEEGLYCPLNPEPEPLLDGAKIEEERRSTRMTWTPVIDAQLVEDFIHYVVNTGDIRGILLLCAKYRCSIEGIRQRLDHIHARTLRELAEKWRAFQETRLGGIRYPVLQPEYSALEQKNVVVLQ